MVRRITSRLTNFVLLIAILMSPALIPGCAGKNDDAYKKEIEDWKAKRLTRLTREDGWLTLCGLSWLKQGENPIGSDSSNTVVLPAGKAPAHAGSIWVDSGKIRLEAKPEAGMKYKDSAITSMALLSDEAPEPTIIKLGTLSFYVIKRGDQLGVRIKDKENPARVNFKGLDYFPVDPKWKIEATYKPYTPPKIVDVLSQVNTIEKDSCPGAVEFDVNGQTQRLDVFVEAGSEDQFWIMFEDATSGKETYANGRQLYTPVQDSTGKVIIDFNKALNWPCVFTDFATCPIPPKQNRMAIRVEAGEKMYKGHE